MKVGKNDVKLNGDDFQTRAMSFKIYVSYVLNYSHRSGEGNVDS